LKNLQHFHNMLW